MRSIILALSILGISVLLFKGYTGGGDNKAGDHVWKHQTDTIKKAEDVNQLIQDAAKKQQQAIKRQTQP